MAISSASSRIFKAEDPVMETDLQLLAKVNEYNEDKFQEGARQLQNEVDNWAMLRNVVKPADKQYINEKLNQVVSGINNMGGVDLADPNNVNMLKNLGYTLYGDEKVMNPVITSQKMSQLSQDINSKLSGKDAKNYDSVYGEYLMHQYNDWINDGKQGTSFDGPTSLPQGSFDNYNKKVQESIAKLQPDINDAPISDKDAALNYYQVGDKFIKKDRIKAAIDSVTSAEDRQLLTAHSWKSMINLPDTYILNLQKSDYDNRIKEMQDNYNYLLNQKALTPDFKQKQLFQSQADELSAAINDARGKKTSLDQYENKPLPKEVRQELSDNLFYNSYKDGLAAAHAYEQKKVELKTNQAAVSKARLDQENYWHGKNYDIKVQELQEKKDEGEWKKQALFMKMYGFYSGANIPGMGGLFGIVGPGQTAPLSLQPVLGKDDAIHIGEATTAQAEANYTAAAKDFYETGYNYLMSKDPVLYGKYLTQDVDGHWIPKNDASEKFLSKGMENFQKTFGEIANMSVKERNGLHINNDDLDLFKKSQALEEARLYKNQIQSIASDVFKKAGLEDPTKKTITIPLNKGSKFGNTITKTYADLKQMVDKKDPLLDEWKKNATQAFAQEGYTGIKGLAASLAGKLPGTNSIDQAISTVNDYYNNASVKKAWEDVGKTVNPYAQVVSLPKGKNNQLPDQAAKVLVDAIVDPNIKKNASLADMDISKVWSTFDPNTLNVKYMAEVRYQRPKKSTKDVAAGTGDKYTTVDLTKQVTEQDAQGGGWLSNLYANDNAQVAYGLALQRDGKTPFDPKNNFEGALQTHSAGIMSHKYQVVAVKDPVTKGVSGYKVFVAIPLGKDKTGTPKFQVVPVPNFLSDQTGKNTTFPANFKGVRDYMESIFKNTDAANDFYTRMNIPFNQ